MMFLIALFIFAAFARAHVLRPQIIGGEDANIEDFPYQVSAESSGGRQYCGGSIISKNYVITAAHCIGGIVQIRVGANFSSIGGQVVSLSRKIVHPDYDSSQLSFDVAILELKTPLVFSEKVNKIDLPSEEELAENTTVVVTGYGVTDVKKSRRRLQVVEVPIVSREKCRNAYGAVVTDDMICAGKLGVGGQDSCYGDSGGPLARSGKLYGIVSWGQGCAQPEYPGVYSNVVHLLPFIKSVTGLGN